MLSPKKSNQIEAWYNRRASLLQPANDNCYDELASLHQFPTLVSEGHVPEAPLRADVVSFAMIAIVVMGWGVVMAESVSTLEGLLF